VLLLTVGAAACAPKTAPALPPSLKYPDFVYPASTGAAASQTEAVDRGWRFLQNDDLGSADREFTAALKRMPDFVPARTGEAYVALAGKNYQKALTDFDAALRGAPTYAPALVGKGQTLLLLKRDGEALTAFEAALRADASLPNLSERIDVLRFRSVQQTIGDARAAAAANRLDDARNAYQRALTASPDSAVMHRELGAVERKQGDAAAALQEFTKASELDPSDTISLTQVAELLEARQDFAGEEAAYRKAAAVEPGAGFEAKADAAAARARDALLPAEFRAIATERQISRGDLAALIGVRFETLLQAAPASQVVTTDTQGYWAARWIARVAAAGVMPPFENHTFQPRAPVRRVDLAEASSALLRLLASSRPALQARLGGRPSIADVGPTHLNYPAVAASVSSGVVPLLDGNRFDITRTVTGAEAVAAIDRLRAFADVR